MPFIHSISVIGCHAEGEVGDVIVSGIPDIPGANMHDKMLYFATHAETDTLRRLLLNEPRGRSSMNTNLILPPCDPSADAGLVIMESDEYACMSGSNAICAVTVLLETGGVVMKESGKEVQVPVRLDTPAGVVNARARCEGGKCKSVEVDNVPAFVVGVGYVVDVQGLDVPVDGDVRRESGKDGIKGGGEAGTKGMKKTQVSVDIAWGGTMYALVDAASVGLTLEHKHGPKIVEYAQKIKKAVQEQIETPVHPENPAVRGISSVVFTGPVEDEDETDELDETNGTDEKNETDQDGKYGKDGTDEKACKNKCKTSVNTVIVSPGRFDRSPCGTGTSARMAVMHARGQLAIGETFRHRSIIGTEFVCRIRGTTQVGEYPAILPTVRGRAWVTSFKQVVLDADDPFPEGFRVGDQWYVGE